MEPGRGGRGFKAVGFRLSVTKQKLLFHHLTWEQLKGKKTESKAVVFVFVGSKEEQHECESFVFICWPWFHLCLKVKRL